MVDGTYFMVLIGLLLFSLIQMQNFLQIWLRICQKSVIFFNILGNVPVQVQLGKITLFYLKLENFSGQHNIVVKLFMHVYIQVNVFCSLMTLKTSIISDFCGLVSLLWKLLLCFLWDFVFCKFGKWSIFLDSILMYCLRVLND